MLHNGLYCMSLYWDTIRKLVVNLFLLQSRRKKSRHSLWKPASIAASAGIAHVNTILFKPSVCSQLYSKKLWKESQESQICRYSPASEIDIMTMLMLRRLQGPSEEVSREKSLSSHMGTGGGGQEPRPMQLLSEMVWVHYFPFVFRLSERLQLIRLWPVGPCSWHDGWTWWLLKILSNPNYFMIH